MLRTAIAAALLTALALPSHALTGAEKAEQAGRCLLGLGLIKGTEAEVGADKAHFAVVSSTALGLKKVQIVVNDGILLPTFVWGTKATMPLVKGCLAGGKT